MTPQVSVARLEATNFDATSFETIDFEPADITGAGRTHPMGTVGRRRILHAFLTQTLGYTSKDAHHELGGLERSASDSMVERIDSHLRASGPVRQAQDRRARPAVMKLTNSRPGGELVIVRVSGAAPTLLAYLAEVGLAVETRLAVRRHRSNSSVMTIQIRGQAQEIHLGSVATDALWVETAV